MADGIFTLFSLSLGWEGTGQDTTHYSSVKCLNPAMNDRSPSRTTGSKQEDIEPEEWAVLFSAFEKSGTCSHKTTASMKFRLRQKEYQAVYAEFCSSTFDFQCKCKFLFDLSSFLYILLLGCSFFYPELCQYVLQWSVFSHKSNTEINNMKCNM